MRVRISIGRAIGHRGSLPLRRRDRTLLIVRVWLLSFHFSKNVPITTSPAEDKRRSSTIHAQQRLRSIREWENKRPGSKGVDCGCRAMFSLNEFCVFRRVWNATKRSQRRLFLRLPRYRISIVFGICEGIISRSTGGLEFLAIQKLDRVASVINLGIGLILARQVQPLRFIT